jgi:hypothetical protein
MSRFANLTDKPKARPKSHCKHPAAGNDAGAPPSTSISAAPRSKSRDGRKAIAGYFSPDLSLAMHVCARKHCLSLQELMAEAFNDVLRKYGHSPVGND